MRERAVVATSTLAGGILLTAVYALLQVYGPASRVRFFEYLISPGIVNYGIAAVTGAWLGVSADQIRRSASYSRIRVIVGASGGAAAGVAASAAGLVVLSLGPEHRSGGWLVPLALLPVVAAWWGAALFFDARKTTPAGTLWKSAEVGATLAALFCLTIPQLMAFPKNAPPAEREAWARRHVRQFGSLAHTIASLPEIREDVGPVTIVAPTARGRHIAAQEMDGVGMNFTLDVIGEKGTGTFHSDCVVFDDAVYSWNPGTWTFNGKTTTITAAPNQVRTQ